MTHYYLMAEHEDCKRSVPVACSLNPQAMVTLAKALTNALWDGQHYKGEPGLDFVVRETPRFEDIPFDKWNEVGWEEAQAMREQ